MDFAQLFLQRHKGLYEFYLDGIWTTVPADLLRQRPHPRVNSLAWNLWHISRVEDAGLNRFVVDRPQVLDDGPWMERMNLPWRHHGGEMSFAEVDELNARIDLTALHDYTTAVQQRTEEIVTHLDWASLDATLEADRLRLILVDEGLAHSNAEGFIANYLGWSKSRCLIIFGLTHPYLHVGEMEVLASLLGVEFE